MMIGTVGKNVMGETKPTRLASALQKLGRETTSPSPFSASCTHLSRKSMGIPADILECFLPTSPLPRIQHQSVDGSTLLSWFSIILSIKNFSNLATTGTSLRSLMRTCLQGYTRPEFVEDRELSQLMINAGRHPVRYPVKLKSLCQWHKHISGLVL